jgi:uncharacterized protein YecE (DUF72 family)
MARDTARGRLRVGTSGYDYPHWRGVFYPPDTPRRAWFAHYAGRFDTVELDSTFYGLPSEATVEAWKARAPRGFRYAAKFSRYGTHRKKLRDPAATIETFLERLAPLGSALGPILVQLPPRWRADPGRLDAFLAAAPRRRRWAVEVRDPSWLCDAVFDVLAAHGAALCLHDLLPRHPQVLTTSWTYLRFHGARDAGGYRPQALAAAARRVRGWLAGGHDVYAFFNNDAQGRAPANALDLARYVRR